MPTGPIVRDRPIPGGAGSPTGAPDQGSITIFVEDSTHKFLIPVFGNVAKDAKDVKYNLATATVTINVDGVQLSKHMEVALPNGELVKELEGSLNAIKGLSSANTGTVVHPNIR